MASGIHSTVLFLKTRLIHRWVPKWQGAFTDGGMGGFYERLNRSFKPIQTGQRRLVGQCRQLSIYSHAFTRFGVGDETALRRGFDHILNSYHDPKTGLWWFSVDDHGKVKDRFCDLYALSFVIFSCAHYGQATGDDRARKAATDVLTLIHDKFKAAPHAGYVEAVDHECRPLSKLRRQNPHMHLLEACLFAFDVWKDSAYMHMADEMVMLFEQYFLSPDQKSVIEFFNDDLSPHPTEGHKCEPGHAFEWVWLLKKYAVAKQTPDRYNAMCLSLLSHANHTGWDDAHGGIYDEIALDGTVLKDTKRIWPFCEGLKANALMLDHASDRQDVKDRTKAMVDVLLDDYIDKRGFWTEWLTRTLDATTDYMPSTTPYHVYFGIMETADALDARGAHKSFMADIAMELYARSRQASRSVQMLFKKR